MKQAIKQVPSEDAERELAFLSSGSVVKLTPKQDAFARFYVEYGNASVAYRKAYDVSLDCMPQTVWQHASTLLGHAQVSLRIKELRKLSEFDSIITVRELLQQWVDVASADPNELVRVLHDNCRRCYGVDFKYQWIDESEFIKAALNDPENVSFDGGVGFIGNKLPNPMCPCCYGAGIDRVVIADTTKLSPKALRLYAGAKVDKNGRIEIKMHDQQKARDAVARMLGAYKDTVIIPGVNAPTPEQTTIESNLTPEDAAQAYLRMVR